MRLKFLICVCFMISHLLSFSAKKDSLNKALRVAKEDTIQVKTLKELTFYYLFEENDVNKALEYNLKAFDLAKKIKSDYWSGKMSALIAYIKQNYKGDYEGAIQYNFLALKYYDSAKNTKDKLAVYINLGTLYFDYGQFQDAEKYLTLAKKIALETKNEEDLALCNSNLGAIYDEFGKLELAIDCFQKALDYYKKINSELDIARMNYSIANITLNKSKDNISKITRLKAIEIYKRVLPIFKVNENLEFYLGSLINLGSQLSIIGELDESQVYLVEAEKIASDAKNYKMLINVYSSTAVNYKRKNNFQNEAVYLRKVIAANDSLFNETKSKAIAEVQIKYQTDKIESENKLLMKDSEIKDLENKNNKIAIQSQVTQRNYLIGGCIVILVIAFYIFSRFRLSQKQKKIIEQQKLMVDQKQLEITDSIKYAKRLQEAILPPMKLVKKYFPESFILYKPKDIVAGDFYWMESFNQTTKSDGKISKIVLFACADCTGHGVPGAMVSVVCSNAMNRAVKEFGITDPGKILDKVRELVIETFEKSESEVNDGMDISFCAFTLPAIGELNGGILHWSGANNPLWIIKNNSMEIMDIKPNKQPIGRYKDPKPFTTHSIELSKGDCIYISTDGYADQFGGSKGKKFKYANLLKLLKEISPISMNQQVEKLNQNFESWQGQLEQVDDVCIIGIRV